MVKFMARFGVNANRNSSFHRLGELLKSGNIYPLMEDAHDPTSQCKRREHILICELCNAQALCECWFFLILPFAFYAGSRVGYTGMSPISTFRQILLKMEIIS